MTTPAEQNRATVTQIINKGLEDLAKVEGERITNAQIEQLKQAKARQDRAEQARFLSMVVGATNEDTPMYTETEADAAVKAAHNEWKEANNG